VLCRVEGAGDRFALTFDDGPSPTNTPRLLDLLASHGAHATFFVLADHARRHPELVARAAAEGHEVGVHGVRHLPPALLPAAWLRREIETCAAAVTGATGLRPRFYRAPFGWLLPAQARAVRSWGLEPVLGDVYPEDSRGGGAARIAGAVCARLREGSIVILHDASVFADASRGDTLAAVKVILAAAAKRGLRSVSLGSLTGGPAATTQAARSSPSPDSAAADP
jgi:peptidoglycan/xylan/chitin deacetylase (PgdA/CDA1 family)